MHNYYEISISISIPDSVQFSLDSFLGEERKSC